MYMHVADKHKGQSAFLAVGSFYCYIMHLHVGNSMLSLSSNTYIIIHVPVMLCINFEGPSRRRSLCTGA